MECVSHVATLQLRDMRHIPVSGKSGAEFVVL